MRANESASQPVFSGMLLKNSNTDSWKMDFKVETNKSGKQALHLHLQHSLEACCSQIPAAPPEPLTPPPHASWVTSAVKGLPTIRPFAHQSQSPQPSDTSLSGHCNPPHTHSCRALGWEQPGRGGTAPLPLGAQWAAGGAEPPKPNMLSTGPLPVPVPGGRLCPDRRTSTMAAASRSAHAAQPLIGGMNLSCTDGTIPTASVKAPGQTLPPTLTAANQRATVSEMIPIKLMTQVFYYL